MEWPRLLSAQRIGGTSTSDELRSPFERDHGRIIFSNAFRRLHAKTQVFPVPDNDHVHSRLTHSLEVAEVGRTLGLRVGEVIAQRHNLGERTAHDMAQIVATACLAHDIGNPPFGHAGEDAIGHYFRAGGGQRCGDELSDQEQADLHYFEGNAQGFRILTQRSMYRNEGGMRLTAAVLGAFTKYPQGSLQRKDPTRRVSGKKFGTFASEHHILAEVAEACGLIPVQGQAGAWCRHPLAYLMEAADDICYHLLDLEDGAMLGLIDHQTVRDCIAPIIGETNASISSRDLSALRAQAINILVDACIDKFIACEADLLAGSFEYSLCDLIPQADALSAIGSTNMRHCYRAPVVLGLEQAGYTVIAGLLEALLCSIRGERNPNLRQMLPDNFEQRMEELSPAQRLFEITDFISGMTDRHAVKWYRQFTGIELTSV